VANIELSDREVLVEETKENLASVANRHFNDQTKRNPPKAVNDSFDTKLSLWVAKKLERRMRNRIPELDRKAKWKKIAGASVAFPEIAKAVIVKNVDPAIRQVCSDPDPESGHVRPTSKSPIKHEFKNLPSELRSCCTVIVRELYPRVDSFELPVTSKKDSIKKISLHSLNRLQRKKARGVELVVLNELEATDWDGVMDQVIKNLK